MKRILLVLVVLVVLAAVAAFLLADRAVEEVVERGGTSALGVDTELGSARLGFFAGELALGDLVVENPEGFDGPFFAVRELDLDVELGSLLGDTVEIPEIALNDVELQILRTGDGSNYGPILESLERFESEEPTEPKAGPALNVGVVRLTNVHAVVDVVPLAGEAARVEVTVPEIVIEDVTDGLSVSQMIALVTKTALTAVVEAGGGALPTDLRAELESRLDALSDVALTHVGATVQSVVEGAGEAVREAQEEAEKVLGETGKVLEGLGGGSGEKKERGAGEKGGGDGGGSPRG